MTAETDLLPLPEHFAHQSERVQEHVRAYTRANLAPLQAEVERLREEVAEWKRVAAAQAELHGEAEDENERLRADVERLRTDGGSAVRWAPSSAHWSAVLRELFGPNARDGIDATEARLREERERAERLAEALREAAEAMKREAIKEQIGGLTKGDPEKIARADRLLALIDSQKESARD